jgi:hypothetical protein
MIKVRHPYRDDVGHWVMRAEEARTIAEDMQDSEMRRLVLSIAETYDSLGRRAAQRLSETALPKNDEIISSRRANK